MRRTLASVVLLVVVAAGCGDEEPSAEESGRSEEPAAWTGQALDGVPGADSPVILAAAGDQTTITFTTDDGTIQGFVSEAGEPFEGGEPLATETQYLALGGVARLGADWIAVGSGGLSGDGDLLQFDVEAFRSTDGRSWQLIEATGLAGPSDVTGVAAVGEGLVAVGTLRLAPDPAMGGFQPVAWHTRDGVAWTQVPLPTGEARTGTVNALAVVDGEVLAVGSLGEGGALWSSTDGGATWTIEERTGVPESSSLNSIAAAGSTLVLSGTPPYRGEVAEAEGAERLLVHAADGGETWTPAATPPPSEGFDEGYGTTITTAGGQFFTVTSTFIMGFDDPERCYADLELCQQDAAEVLYTSADGDRWARVDTSGIGEGEAGEVWEVGGPPDGPLVALTGSPSGLGAWTWPASAPLPTEAEPTDPTTEVVVLGYDDPMEPGVTYGVPLYIHCGMDWLYVDGTAWERTDGGPDAETGAGDVVDPAWPVAQQTIYGFATLGANGEIDYSIDSGEVIATYAPTDVQPPGCE